MIELLIHLEVPSHNQLNEMHWSKRHKLGSQWGMAIRCAAGADDIDSAKGKRHVHILAYRKRRMTDEANLIAGANKTLVDALVRCGLLVDDSDKLATFTYAQDVASKSPTKRPCTRIVITEIP